MTYGREPLLNVDMHFLKARRGRRPRGEGRGDDLPDDSEAVAMIVAAVASDGKEGGCATKRRRREEGQEDEGEEEKGEENPQKIWARWRATNDDDHR